MTEGMKCKCGQNMELIDAHLVAVSPEMSYKPHHGHAGLRLVKVYRCKSAAILTMCEELVQVSEEVRP